MADVVQFERLDRLLAGTRPAGAAAERPPPTAVDARQIARQAVMKLYARDHLRPPLDRLSADELARFRLRARARHRP